MFGFPRTDFPLTDSAEPAWPGRAATPAFATNGMVASAHPLVTSTALDILRSGGNAVDAAVGAGLVAAVVMPEMCGLGGDLFALVREADSAEVHAVRGSGAAPAAATLERMRSAGDGVSMPSRGPLSVTVPGMIDGYDRLLERFGTLRFADVVPAAVGYAEAHPVSAVRLAYTHRFADLLRQYPSSAQVFLPDGAPHRPGDLLRQPDLAQTLRTLAADGPRAFYEGDVAERMVRGLAEAGGVMSTGDLAEHRSDVTAPLSTTYREHTVYQVPLPSQGLIALEALNIAERFDLGAAGVGSADGVHVLVEAIKLAFADRRAYCQDPAAGPAPVERLLSKQWAKERGARIETRAAQQVAAGPLDESHTTYLCVVDKAGTMISLIQSVAANFGSGIIAGDTGVLLNNRAQGFALDESSPNVFAPGKKPMHTLNCYLIADPSGQPILVGGTPGGDRQPQWNVQVITGLVDAGWDVQQAIEQPKWISSPSADGSGFDLTIEKRAPAEVRDELASRGHRVRPCDDWAIDCAAQVIVRDPATGVLAGGSDPRTEGAVGGY